MNTDEEYRRKPEMLYSLVFNNSLICVHLRLNFSVLAFKDNRYGFLLDSQPQSWPQEALDFFLKKIRKIKTASVMQTIPRAV